ncbi:BamA/TamA family outer membrane protein [Ruegeria profundi]|uniref:BamA/TamA family outer membrane protein n=1 Tax=Ruegeria profundi TaxID=1685378 RepID=UPI001CD49FB8|nr:BamA/TamA family outer membrane protein [Ruegeria profundi]MCA0930073.1 outer membrane protein assembly factor [Ruegeria profundi]
MRNLLNISFLAPTVFSLLVSTMLSIGTANANPNIINKTRKSVDVAVEEQKFGIRNGSTIVAPVPFSNPVIGTGLTLGVGYLFVTAPDADPSFFALGAMASSNGSQAYGIGADVSFQNGWSFDFALAEAQLSYDLFFGSQPISIDQDGTLFNAGSDYKLSNNFSIGAGLRYLDSSISLASSNTPIPGDLVPDLNLEVATIELRILWDERNDKTYPTDGKRFSVSANVGETLGAGDRQYGFGSANFDFYRSISETGMFAGRVSACAASSDTPFFDKCSIGFSDSFRGFDPLQYLDTRLLSAQLEYRQRLGKRFGVVAFGGLGYTASSFADLLDNGDRIAVGAGVRYRVSKQYPLDFSLDFTTNNDQEEYVYIFIGQRF